MEVHELAGTLLNYLETVHPEATIEKKVAALVAAKGILDGVMAGEMMVTMLTKVFSSMGGEK